MFPLFDKDKMMAGPSKEPKWPQYRLVSKNEERGLSLLVKNMLGKPLSKGEQMSNWEKRPLRSSQITYAGKLSATCSDNLKLVLMISCL